MATHAHTTSTLLRPAPAARSALLPTRSVGPVTAAIRAVRAGQDAAIARERVALRVLRQAIADRIEADIALLDQLDGDPDLEGQDSGHDLDAEGGTDDNGIADAAGAWQQGFGFYGQYGLGGFTRPNL